MRYEYKMVEMNIKWLSGYWKEFKHHWQQDCVFTLHCLCCSRKFLCYDLRSEHGIISKKNIHETNTVISAGDAYTS